VADARAGLSTTATLAVQERIEARSGSALEVEA